VSRSVMQTVKTTMVKAWWEATAGNFVYFCIARMYSRHLPLDYILLFGEVPENDREIDGLDDKSELALSCWSASFVYLALSKTKKQAIILSLWPTQVILHLSPTTVFSEKMAFTRSRKSPSKHYLIVGTLRAGMSIYA
jgi:hypothetical protein